MLFHSWVDTAWRDLPSHFGNWHRIYADKRDMLANKEIAAVILSREGRKEPMGHDEEMYKRRHRIENWFSWLKDFRALATRYDKLAVHFLSGVYLAAIFTWMK